MREKVFYYYHRLSRQRIFPLILAHDGTKWLTPIAGVRSRGMWLTLRRQVMLVHAISFMIWWWATSMSSLSRKSGTAQDTSRSGSLCAGVASCLSAPVVASFISRAVDLSFNNDVVMQWMGKKVPSNVPIWGNERKKEHWDSSFGSNVTVWIRKG